MIDILHCGRRLLYGQYRSGIASALEQSLPTLSLHLRVGYLPPPRQICAPSTHPRIASSEEVSPRVWELTHLRIIQPDPDPESVDMTDWGTLHYLMIRVANENLYSLVLDIIFSNLLVLVSLPQSGRLVNFKSRSTMGTATWPLSILYMKVSLWIRCLVWRGSSLSCSNRDVTLAVWEYDDKTHLAAERWIFFQLVRVGVGVGVPDDGSIPHARQHQGDVGQLLALSWGSSEVAVDEPQFTSCLSCYLVDMIVPFKVVVEVHLKVLLAVNRSQDGATQLVHIGQYVPPPPDMHHVTLWQLKTIPQDLAHDSSCMKSCWSTTWSSKLLMTLYTSTPSVVSKKA